MRFIWLALSFIPQMTDDMVTVSAVIKRYNLRMFFLLYRRRKLAGRTLHSPELILKSAYLCQVSKISLTFRDYRGDLQVALDLYRKAESYVPHNVKLKERWILFVVNVFLCKISRDKENF